jgi:hypothetical protein
MASKPISRLMIFAVAVALFFGGLPTPALAHSASEPASVKVHTFEFYLDPSLVPDLDFAKAVLPKYIADMNTILAKNTDRRLVLDAETGIILTSTQPHSNNAAYPLPVDGFEIWAHAVPSSYPVSYGGYAGIDKSGAGVIAGLKWTRLYDPDHLQGDEISDYWTQINNMLHEVAHVFGAGIGEYYNLAVVKDTTEIAPLLEINLLDSDDSFWKDKPDFLADPLLQNPVRASNLGPFPSRAALLAFVQYSQLTAAVINGDYRNSLPTPDLSGILVNVVDSKGAPVAAANVKIWSVVGDSSSQSQLMVDAITDGNGQVDFAWGGSAMPHNVYDFLRLIKVYKTGYAASAKYVSIFDLDIEKLVYGKDRVIITIALQPADSLQAPVATFADVPVSDGAWRSIEAIYSAGITGGCGVSPLVYCPSTPVTRAQMAVFLERGIHGPSYVPSAVTGGTSFADISPGYWAAAWIKQLNADGITDGCGAGNYCPESSVTRAQMAVFLLRAKYGASYTPPSVGTTGFSDVPADHWAAAWIKQLAAEGITSGCGAGSYCPETPITRAQLAVFMTISVSTIASGRLVLMASQRSIPLISGRPISIRITSAVLLVK